MLRKNFALLLLMLTAGGYCAAAPARDLSAIASLPSDSFVHKSMEARKKLIHKHLPLNSREAHDFWPIYDEYQQELMLVYIQRKATITKLGRHFDAMTDDFAKQFVMESIALQEERLHVLHNYFKKFEIVLPGKQLLRFYQIENRFRSAVDAELAERIPLLK
ncbi:hypothetical protein F6R98_12240 [Candidatus Methylospira mobilis]|uniref:Uncharacterized protein n=1 Tax=Candidatus Methylospira mobilis TaxID=1808979 RepID=A0A5Q0BM38_9GAMM|nr:hypothetical protein [Candidatus Methylospira mobilis]QFY43291.1 hypothetical protein F6R98_12240 [Candidatus Methylospira mobilis]